MSATNNSLDRASVRRHVIIEASAKEVWNFVGDPNRIQEWFPGIIRSTLEGNLRTITTNSGISITEEIVTNDPLQHRFQYKINAPFVVEHLSTIDLFQIGDDRCLIAYSVDADPSTMALVIGAAGGNALHNLKTIVERN